LYSCGAAGGEFEWHVTRGAFLPSYDTFYQVKTVDLAIGKDAYTGHEFVE